jgi:hypothetical protein
MKGNARRTWGFPYSSQKRADPRRAYAASLALTGATVMAVHTVAPAGVGKPSSVSFVAKKAPRERGSNGADSALGWGARKSALAKINATGGGLFPERCAPSVPCCAIVLGEA